MDSLCIRCKGKGLCGKRCKILDSFIKDSPKIKEHFSGSSPPEVFVGRVDYPNVFCGVLSPNEWGDTAFYIVLAIILIVAIAILAIIYFVIFRTPNKKSSSGNPPSSVPSRDGPPQARPPIPFQRVPMRTPLPPSPNVPLRSVPPPAPSNVPNNSSPQNRAPLQSFRQ